MSENNNGKRTPLYGKHVRLGARIVPFGGYMMPVHYTGILAEHRSVRETAAVFDTCHMGEIRVSGTMALADLENLVSSDLGSLAVGCCRYGFLCNHEGGIIDDLLVYRMDDTEFMLVVNAGTCNGDLRWISSHVSGTTEVFDMSGTTAKIDIQGPNGVRIVQEMMDRPIDGLKFYSFLKNTYKGHPVLVSRTGYTGEVGFELYSDTDLTGVLWDEAVERGALPAGLGARDTLRLEMGMPLYGHELSTDRNARETGLQRFISKTKDFIGSAAARNISGHGEILAGMAFEGRKAARSGNRIFSESGRNIGVVTSGSFAPSLGYAVALGYIDPDFAEPGTRVEAEAGRIIAGQVVELPFFREGTARRPLTDFLD